MTKLHNTNKVQCHKVWQNYTIQIKYNVIKHDKTTQYK